MKIVVVIRRQRYHLFSAYAPQTGCSEQTKDTFWNLLDEKTAEAPLQGAIDVGGDLNGHVGALRKTVIAAMGFWIWVTLMGSGFSIMQTRIISPL
uniref:Transposase n=1 Tax=Haemonchus placei TaxID=6290 RepID=A0A0N4X6J3_HAEPC